METGEAQRPTLHTLASSQLAFPPRRISSATCAAEGLNGEELSLFHANPLLAPFHNGYTLAGMYLICINRVTVQIPDTFDLHNHQLMLQSLHTSSVQGCGSRQMGTA